jgi:hypothetical protein
MERQTLDIHWVAWALDPVTCALKLSQGEMARAEAFLKENCTAEAWPGIKKTFHDFRAREGPIFGPGISNDTYDTRFRPRDT